MLWLARQKAVAARCTSAIKTTRRKCAKRLKRTDVEIITVDVRDDIVAWVVVNVERSQSGRHDHIAGRAAWNCDCPERSLLHGCIAVVHFDYFCMLPSRDECVQPKKQNAAKRLFVRTVGKEIKRQTTHSGKNYCRPPLELLSFRPQCFSLQQGLHVFTSLPTRSRPVRERVSANASIILSRSFVTSQ